MHGWLNFGPGESTLRVLGVSIGFGILAALLLAGWKINRAPPLLALTLFALNRNLAEPMSLDVALRGFGKPVLAEALQLKHKNLKATNTKKQPHRVSPTPLKDVQPGTDRLQATLAPASWNMIRLDRPR